MGTTPKLTVLYTYYGQRERIPGILAEVHQEARYVIVDDGSTEPLGPLPGIDVYRIDVDIPWNQPGARNLGFHVSDGWIVCCDIDHLVTRENVDKLIAVKKKYAKKGTVYYLNRDSAIESMNVFLIHKGDFYSIGGYDEDFSGHYGWDDWDFIRRVPQFTKLDFVKVKDFSEASHVKSLSRDDSYNRELFYRKGHRLRFPWHKVS